MLRQYLIKIYTTYKNQIPKMSFVQNDTETNKISFEMYDNINVPTTGIFYASATVKRPDGKTYTYGMTDGANNNEVFKIEDNVVTFTLPPSAVFVGQDGYIASISSTSIINPLILFLTSSNAALHLFVEIIGSPQDIASLTTNPHISSLVGSTNTSAL
jgi:hypothetical protein